MGPTGAKPARKAKKSRRRIKPNDLEMLDCLAHGWTPGEIAEEYAKGTQAVQVAITRLRERMNAKTTAHAVALFLQHPERFLSGYYKPVAAAMA